MYDTTWWSWLVTVWEVVVYNKVLDLQQCWQVQLSQCPSQSCREFCGASLLCSAYPATLQKPDGNQPCTPDSIVIPVRYQTMSFHAACESPRKDFVTLKQSTCVALYPQIVLPVGVLAFVGLKWYHRSRRRRRQREEKHIVRQGSRQDIRDLNV